MQFIIGFPRHLSAQVDFKNLGFWGNFLDIASLLNILVKNFMIISFLMLFAIIIGGGFMVIRNAGSGDAQATENGKKALTAAIIGAVLIFSAYWIVQIVAFITGMKIPGF